jgi:hypothetical protein
MAGEHRMISLLRWYLDAVSEAKAFAPQVQGGFSRRSTGPQKSSNGQLEESRFHPFRVKMRERLRDKVRYCAYTALIPTVEDQEHLPLPKPLFPLYYVVRPVRLSGRYGQRLFGCVLR